MSTRHKPILGSRRLAVIGTRRKVTVTIGLPQRAAADWYCTVDVSGAGLHVRRRVPGADELQAIQLALEFARLTLARAELPLTWNDSAPGAGLDWTGFQRLVPPFFGPKRRACEKRVDQCIAQELRAALKALKKASPVS